MLRRLHFEGPTAATDYEKRFEQFANDWLASNGFVPGFVLKRPRPYVRRHMACADCRVDTSSANGIGHYYSLRDKLWDQATRGDGRCRFLCLDCLEERLGRPLRAEDFDLTPPELYERLRDGEHVLRSQRERQRWLDYWRAVPRHRRPVQRKGKQANAQMG